jgi:hypothetical protein
MGQECSGRRTGPLTSYATRKTDTFGAESTKSKQGHVWQDPVGDSSMRKVAQICAKSTRSSIQLWLVVKLANVANSRLWVSLSLSLKWESNKLLANPVHGCREHESKTRPVLKAKCIDAAQCKPAWASGHFFAPASAALLASAGW